MKRLIVLLIFLYSNFIEAQNLDVYYSWITTPQKNYLQDPVKFKTNIEKEGAPYPFVLSIRNNISLFTALEFIPDLNYVDDNDDEVTVWKDELREYACYKNFTDKKITIKNYSFFKVYLLSDSLLSYQWKLENEFKDISGYKCQKATTYDMHNNEVVAWFTEDIPVSNGPKEFWGLPGLIIYLNAANRSYAVEKIIFIPEEDIIDMNIPDEGLKMDISTYLENYRSTKSHMYKSWDN